MTLSTTSDPISVSSTNANKSSTGQLFLGDLITEVNGVAVATVEDLLALVEETEIGSDVVLRVMRGADASKLETVRVKTVDRAQLR
jgi:S1-C subfamily serine protease